MSASEITTSSPASSPREGGEPRPKVIAVVACDLDRAPLGGRSRLGDRWGDHTVLGHTVRRIAAVAAVEKIILMVSEGVGENCNASVSPAERNASLHSLGLDEFTLSDRLVLMPLLRRQEQLTRRVQAGRAWGQMSWRGGAGQWTVFDEDYHPQSVWSAVEQFGDPAEGAVLCVPAHAALVSSALLANLVDHHLTKNHELPYTYCLAAPGFGGFILSGKLTQEMAQHNLLPGQLLAYDPLHPVFDTIIREGCMQVDPALSRISNRVLLDTDRSWLAWGSGLEDVARSVNMPPAELAAWCAQRRQTCNRWPMELEIELTIRRATTPPGTVSVELRHALKTLPAGVWETWLAAQSWPDDLTLTVAGAGDPLLYPELLSVLRAARRAGIRHIHLQTDLLSDSETTPTWNGHTLATALEEDLIDVLSVASYGEDSATYLKVAGVDGQAAMHAHLMAAMQQCQKMARSVPLLVGRLLKVQETIGQLESFFDRWVAHGHWAVLDYPTDRAGMVPFAGVVDMAPGRRKPCRRIQSGDGRLLIRCDGQAVACDQDVTGKLGIGNIQSATLEQLWRSTGLETLRQAHAATTNGITLTLEPCCQCREWHRA